MHSCIGRCRRSGVHGYCYSMLVLSKHREVTHTLDTLIETEPIWRGSNLKSSLLLSQQAMRDYSAQGPINRGTLEFWMIAD